MLRYRRLNGFKFRRQQIIGPFIVDFFCPEAKLSIEADGSQHGDEEQAWYDYHRTNWLSANGYRVLRFWNGDVLRFPDQVAGQIEDALAQPPIRRARARHLPPRGGEGLANFAESAASRRCSRGDGPSSVSPLSLTLGGDPPSPKGGRAIARVGVALARDTFPLEGGRAKQASLRLENQRASRAVRLLQATAGGVA